jgi:EAL domain-containing protein (putative c-di-GMP-specific phosphodiesterase class I)
LGFTVIAEGVETQAQADFLQEMGCEEAQGYLYSKPVTATEFTRLLAAKRHEGQTDAD